MAIALVTGGSRGIGRATALLLAQEGYTVAVNYQQNLHAAQEVMNLITQAGGKAFVLQADISDENQVVAMFTAIDQHDEPLAALVNNAGILFTQCTVENLTAERINRVLSTNVTGYFLCCREAVKRMALKNGGSGGAVPRRAGDHHRRHAHARQVCEPRPAGRLQGAGGRERP